MIAVSMQPLKLMAMVKKEIDWNRWRSTSTSILELVVICFNSFRCPQLLVMCSNYLCSRNVGNPIFNVLLRSWTYCRYDFQEFFTVLELLIIGLPSLPRDIGNVGNCGIGTR